MNFDARYLDAILREDLYSFIQKTYKTLEPMQQLLGNWHLEAISWHLKKCMTGEIKRLIITLPPRSLKSISASVAFPAYVLGHEPTKKILCVSYSADLAIKNARECRSIMQGDWYKRLFPHTRLSARAAEHDFHTTQRGYRYTTSVCGTLTGRGGNIIIIDDPMKAEEAMSDVRRKSVNEWFDNTLYSRLDNKKSDVIILIMQRLHMDDMVGHVLKKDKWVHLNLPAIARVDEDIEIGPGRRYSRKIGEALHAAREPLELLERKRNPKAFEQGPAGLKPGVKLVRPYKGEKHVVLVRADGFEYQKKTYNSLSEIAHSITGTRWNGWVFFGLKKRKREDL